MTAPPLSSLLVDAPTVDAPTVGPPTVGPPTVGPPGPGCPHHPGDGDDLRRLVPNELLYRQVSSGRPCWIVEVDGGRRPLPIGRWLGGHAATEEDRRADDALLDRCTGPTLDVGCGPGRLTEALALRGVRAVGVDVSPVAVRLTRQRGVPAVHGDVFGPLPGAGTWSHVLLADGNVGIGGDPGRLLRRVRELLRPGGTVEVDLDLGLGLDLDVSTDEGAAGTGLTVGLRRWETDRSVGAWFPWARLGTRALADVAASAGLVLADVDHIGDRCLVTLR